LRFKVKTDVERDIDVGTKICLLKRLWQLRVNPFVSTKGKGHIHIHVATQNVNLTLQVLPTHPVSKHQAWQ